MLLVVCIIYVHFSQQFPSHKLISNLQTILKQSLHKQMIVYNIIFGACNCLSK